MGRITKRIKRLGSARSLTSGLASSLITFMLGILANEKGIDLAPWVIGALVLVGPVALILRFAAKEDVKVRIETTLPRTPEEEAETFQKRKGLIVFVSLYNPFKRDGRDQLNTADRLAAAAQGDYLALDVMNSNLEPTIRAIINHAGSLEHCWLISTVSYDPGIAGSYPYVLPLVTYLQEEKQIKCSFHWEEYTVPLDDDIFVCQKTYKMIRRIHQEAKQRGIHAEAIVTDFTSGIRSMTLGAFMASLPSDRDIQFMGTKYGSDAKPEGEMFPIIFHYEPSLTLHDE